MKSLFAQMKSLFARTQSPGAHPYNPCHVARPPLSYVDKTSKKLLGTSSIKKINRSHKTGCRTWMIGVPRTSTHWMGPKNTPTCDSNLQAMLELFLLKILMELTTRPRSTSTTETGTAPDVAPGTVAGAVTAVLLEAGGKWRVGPRQLASG